MRPKYFLEKLMKLPHRGTGSENEKKAAEIIFREYQKMGFEPKIHTFKIVKNGWFAMPLNLSLFILSTIFLLVDKIAISLLFYILGISLYLELPFNLVNLYKRIYPGTSQNVYVEVLPKKKPKRTVVVFGHCDSARRTTGVLLLGWIAKKTKLAISADKKLPNFLRGPFFITNFSIILNFIMFFLMPFPAIQAIVGYYVLFTLFLTFLLVLHTFFSPFVPGAFDNGSGAATVMSLASYYKKNEPRSTRLLFLNNGSEENITKGIVDFLQVAKLDKKKTFFINIDSVGADKLLAAYGETDGRGISRFYDKKLFSIVREIIKKEKKFSSIEEFYAPTQSDCTELVNRKLRVMTMMSSINNYDFVDHYHQMTDTIDKINFKNLDLCKNFIIRLIEEVDD